MENKKDLSFSLFFSHLLTGGLVKRANEIVRYAQQVSTLVSMKFELIVSLNMHKVPTHETFMSPCI